MLFRSCHAFYPFGEVRTSTGSFYTQRGFTGQISDSGTGLNFCNARYEDPALGRFISPDSIVPNPANPGLFNRFAYVSNNPLKFTDPTGHCGQTDMESLSREEQALHCSHNKTLPPEQIKKLEFGVSEGSTLDGVHAIFDVVGTLPIPIVGELADLTNAGLYIAEGDQLNALISLLGLVPLAGDAATGARITARAFNGVEPVLKGQAGVKNVLDQLQEQGHVLLGTEVTIEIMDDAGKLVRRRYDTVLRDGDDIYLLEVKNGTKARYSLTQRRRDEWLNTKGGTPVGANAADASLRPGNHRDDMHVRAAWNLEMAD